jgi:hypothetical protein
MFTFLLGLVFTSNSCLAAFGDIYICESVIDIDYDKNLTEKPLLPIDMVLNIPIEVEYYVQGQYADFVTEAYLLRELDAFIYLEIGNTPEWCDATISPPVLIIPATMDGTIEYANLSVQISRDAQAFAEGDVAVKFIVSRMGAVSGRTIVRNVTITTGYLPILDIDVLGDTVKTITPDEMANFDIEIENLGNAKTNLSLWIEDIPDGWTATIPSNLILGAEKLNEDTKRTVQLNVKPPYDVGYHREKETITIVLKPAYFNDDSIAGEEYYLTFIVKNKGFSTPGFEFIFILIGIIVVSLIIKMNNSYFNRRYDK